MHPSRHNHLLAADSIHFTPALRLDATRHVDTLVAATGTRRTLREHFEHGHVPLRAGSTCTGGSRCHHCPVSDVVLPLPGRVAEDTRSSANTSRNECTSENGTEYTKYPRHSKTERKKSRKTQRIDRANIQDRRNTNKTKRERRQREDEMLSASERALSLSPSPSLPLSPLSPCFRRTLNIIHLSHSIDLRSRQAFSFPSVIEVLLYKERRGRERERRKKKERGNGVVLSVSVLLGGRVGVDATPTIILHAPRARIRMSSS